MPDDWKDLDEVLETRVKQLPINGKLVTFPNRVSAKTGALLIRMQQHTQQNPEKAAAESSSYYADFLGQERTEELMAEVLGMSAEEFLPKVGMDGAKLVHVFQTLMLWHLAGEDIAREAWNDPGKVRAQGLAMARKAAAKKPTKKSARPGSRGTSKGRRRG